MTTETDESTAVATPIFRMIGESGGVCVDGSCSIEQRVEPDPA